MTNDQLVMFFMMQIIGHWSLEIGYFFVDTLTNIARMVWHSFVLSANFLTSIE